MPRTLLLVFPVTIVLASGCARQDFTDATISDVSGVVTDAVMDVINVNSTSDYCGKKAVETGALAFVTLVRYTATPPGGSPATFQYHAMIGPMSKVSLLSNGALNLCEGWVYVWTDPSNPQEAIDLYPWVQTAHVDAGADGCDFAVSIDGDVSQVYYFAGLRVKVKPKAGSGGEQTNNARSVVQCVARTGAYTAPTILTGSREETLFNTMDRMATRAKLP